MNNLKIALIVIALAIVGLAAGLGLRALIQSRQMAGGQPTISDTNHTSFAWGVTVLNFPFPTYEESFNAIQMSEAKKLGVNYIRLDYSPFNPKASEAAVQAALAQKLKIVLVVPFGPNDIYTDKNLKANTTDYISGVVNRFKGRVQIYQLATEVASVALNNNPAAHGIELKDYPKNKLTAVTNWLLAATAAIKASDPAAKRLINDQWVHTGFFDNYIAQGGDFDILGWNWFSDMGNSMDTVTLDAKKGQSYSLIAKLQGYGKPIWLTEVSRRLGSQGGNEPAQADFLVTMTNYIQTHPMIQGFFVFNLLEDQIAKPPERGYSLVTAVDDGKGQKITGHKLAFETYQKLIQQYR